MSTGEEKEGKLVLLASRSFANYEDMYKVVDFLNKNIKDKGIMLGLVKDRESGRLNINIYEF